MTRLLLLTASTMALTGCVTASRIALALAPTAGVAANANVAGHCIAAIQAGRPVNLRRVNRLDFLGIEYDMEIRDRTTPSQQKGVADARILRNRRCPTIPDATPPAPPADPQEAAEPVPQS